MLTFACVWADRQFGPEYVNILYDMVRRNLPFGTEGRFICYTDFKADLDPNIWVYPLDSPLEDDCHYLRLDCCIIRPLDGVIDGEPLRVSVYDGSFPNQVQMVVFPDKRPHECDDWVKHVWKVGGGTTSEMTFTPNVEKRCLQANILSASRRDCRWFEPRPAHEETVLIVGGGPSLQDDLEYIKAISASAHVCALNGVPDYLSKHGIIPDSHVVLDAHPNCIEFVAKHLPMIRYYASQCDAAVLDAASTSLICWHGGGEAMQDLAKDGMTFKHIVGGGSTGATRAMILMYGLGYRKFHLFGMDSSYDGDKGHAYEQAEYANFVDVTCGDRVFKSSPQLLGQAEDFKMVLPDLISAACEVTVHGDGLLRAVATQMAA